MKIWFIFLGLLWFTSLASGQSIPDRPDAAALLEQVRGRVLKDVNLLPRYTCAQQIERRFHHSTFQAKDACAAIIAKHKSETREQPLTSWDRLRLDVTVAEGREIHSWPGIAGFNEDLIRKMVAGGPFGGGDFGPFVIGAFGNAASVTFRGERTETGRVLYEYSYEVGALNSHYQVGALSGDITTAYQGSFWLDPETRDIVRMNVNTAELPESTGACQAISEVDYQRIDVRGREILAPQITKLRLISRNGKEAVSTTTYSSCHEYASKSQLRFDITDSNNGASSAQPKLTGTNSIPVITIGARFKVRVVTPIESDNAAGGDALEAVLRTPISDKDGVIVAPRGARIRGRLVRFAEYKESVNYFEVGIQLDSVEVRGVDVPISASPTHSFPVPDRPAVVNPFEGLHDLQTPDLPVGLPPNVAVFFLPGMHWSLNHLDSEWVTTSTNGSIK